jgi:cytochrome c-type biogenesis protein CcmH/NrfG
MNTEQSQRGLIWGNERVFLLAFGCLVVGLVLGYLIRGEGGAQAPTAALPSQVARPQQLTAQQKSVLASQQAAPLVQRLRDDPHNPELLAQIGNIYYDAKQFGKAIEYYRKSLDLRPTDSNVGTDLGTAYFYSGDTEAAIAQFDDVLKRSPTHANALLNLGIVKWRGHGDTTGAAEAWQRLLDTNPSYPQRSEVEQLLKQVQQHANMRPGTNTDKSASF